ncbi:MAG TPA: ketoacyl-ACP synthase III [Streptosporangiaceae bacterium]|nr:ketoacyl-ACP synthase III [Streptosporangiaceae bacterium]
MADIEVNAQRPSACPAPSRLGILGTGSGLPRRRVSNREVAETLDVGEGWVAKATGVLERRVADVTETNLQFAVSAARSALKSAQVSPADIGTIIVATSTPDQAIPGIAPKVQGIIGACNSVAFDINAGCAGFLLACELGQTILSSGSQASYALIIGSDVLSRCLDTSDRRTYPLFGDGAGAVVLGSVSPGVGVLNVKVSTDGRLEHYCSGGPKLPVQGQCPDPTGHYVRLRGREISELVRRLFPELVTDSLKEAGLTVEDIDHLICHQANPVLIRECAYAVGFSPEQVMITGDRLGNTGGASIPIGLDLAVRAGRVRRGDTILMIAFGAGVTAGRLLLRWAANAPAAEKGVSQEASRPAFLLP